MTGGSDNPCGPLGGRHEKPGRYSSPISGRASNCACQEPANQEPGTTRTVQTKEPGKPGTRQTKTGRPGNGFGRHRQVTSLSHADGGRRWSDREPRGVPLRDPAAPDHAAGGQIVTAPLAVSNVTDRMPGVPCGATHSTATSSSGFSTGSPSHSVTRAAEPAMVRQLILTLLS
jgi:hypothetical protein